jgi:hypothetical protein
VPLWFRYWRDFMKKGKLLILVLSLFLMLTVSQGNSNGKVESIIQADFVNMLINVLELQDKLPLSATFTDKTLLLESYGIAPLGGWDLEKKLTKGDVAVVICQMLNIDVPKDAKLDDYISALADRGIMTSGGSDSLFALADLTASINLAAAAELGVFQPKRPSWNPGSDPDLTPMSLPWHTPLSSTN